MNRALSLLPRIKKNRGVTRRVHNLTGFLFRLHREMYRALSLLPRIKKNRGVTRRVHNLTGFLFRMHREMHRALSLLPRNKKNKERHTQGSQLNRVSISLAS